MSPDVYLQVVSILMAIIAVLVPIGITAVAFVYIRQITERLDNLSGEVDKLWDRLKDIQPPNDNNKIQQ